MAGCSHPAAPPVAAQTPEQVRTAVPSVSPSAPAAPGPRPTRTAKAKPDRAGGLDRFVAAVQAKLPDVALDRREDELADLGHQACAGLAAGSKDPAVAADLAEQGVTGADARTLVALAKDTACRA